MSKDLRKKILEKIEKRHLKPKPKWNFVMKNYMVWAIATVSIFIGSLASAVMIFMIRNNDWELLPYISGSKLGYLLASLPYFWLLSIIVLVAVAFYNLKHTKKGYRYPVMIVIIVTVGSSVLLGGVFHAVGWGQAIDNELSENVSLYRDHLDPRRRMWSQAEGGFLAGTIIVLDNEQIFTMRSINGEEWQILYAEARIVGPKDLQINIPVKVIGKKQAEYMIKAELIKTMMGPGQGWLMPHRNFQMRQEHMMNIVD